MAGKKMEGNAYPGMEHYFNTGEIDFDMSGDLTTILNGNYDPVQHDTEFLSDGMISPGFTNSGSHPSRVGSVLSSNESIHWQTQSFNNNSGTLLQNVVNPLQLGGAPLGNELTKESAILNSLIRAEKENTKASQERDAALMSFRQMQHAYNQLVETINDTSRQLADVRNKAEEAGRQHESMMKTMGEQALSEALAYLKKLLDGAPIPVGIRFAPTDYEVFEYLERKIEGRREGGGALDSFLVGRLRGMRDSSGLMPEIELLKYPRPWNLPGLDIAPDGKGQVGYYFVRPQWRHNERRRRREADMSPGDPKPPCWKESCQPTAFEDRGERRPERRMFRFKLPGAREGPAGEKEKWKMYEYTLKSDTEMWEDKKQGTEVWVICKVIREGPMTHEEVRERKLEGGGDGGGGGASHFPDPHPNNGYGGRMSGGYDGRTGSSQSGMGRGGDGGGGALGGGYSAGAQYGRSHAGLAPAFGAEWPKDGGQAVGETGMEGPPTPSARRRGGGRGKGGRGEGSGSSAGSSVLTSPRGAVPGWLANFPDAPSAVKVVLEDYFANKLLPPPLVPDHHPPYWSVRLPDNFYDLYESEEGGSSFGSEEYESEWEGSVEEDSGSATWRADTGSLTDRLMRQSLVAAREVETRVGSLPVGEEVSRQLRGFLREVQQVVEAVGGQAGRDPPAATMWFEKLLGRLQSVVGLVEGAGGSKQSRVLLLIKTPEISTAAQVAVRDLANILALLPLSMKDNLSGSQARHLAGLTADMAKVEFKIDAASLEAIQSLRLALDHGTNPTAAEEDLSTVRALSRMRQLLSGYGAKEGFEIPAAASLMIQVCSVVGIQWDPPSVALEVEKLEASANEKPTADTGADAAVAAGFLALLKACNRPSDCDPIPTMDSFDLPPGKAPKVFEVEVELPPPPRLDFQCHVYAVPIVEAMMLTARRAAGEKGPLGSYMGKMGDVRVVVEKVCPKLTTPAALHKVVLQLAPLRHPHLVPLIGCCLDLSCLVYQALTPVSLEDFFNRPDCTIPNLPWFVRVDIAVDVASTLLYLHSQAADVAIIHGDLSPANIFLGLQPRRQRDADRATRGGRWWPAKMKKEKVVMKLGRVGLGALIPATAKLRPQGTMYHDPWAGRGNGPCVESDVYAFGIILAQLLTGKLTTSALGCVERALKKPGTLLAVLDPLAGKWRADVVVEIAKVAVQCSAVEKGDRPSLAHVVPKLRQLADLKDVASEGVPAALELYLKKKQGC